MSRFARSTVTAVLGPTNTGKTHLAIERMLGHDSGVIGFPLRLLARENYDRIAAVKGTGQVALVTGEEKIVPPNARYFCCTVESMPAERRFAFLAIDEIQLCGDPERGHMFTDRLLHARGTEETMFLGAETVRPVLQRLVPDAEPITRPRLSTLSYVGPRKITRLPPRSAVVAFSATDVYAAAELIRRQKGGTAVVLGHLSPRTRNAQVGMFEAGEVDYLVATDAIGMGLNLNLDHVAFAALKKFDGRGLRRLTAAEIGQIAGRAGRHMSDGSFGTTGALGGLDEELVEAVETHRFAPLRAVYWRNSDLKFHSLTGLMGSLERRPYAPELLRVRDADDHLALAALSRDERIRERADNPAAVRLLWEVCRIPDFRKTLSEQHTGLLARIYLLLMDRGGRLPKDWLAVNLTRLDRCDGDIDQLVARLSHIRTWTYVTHRGDWLADSDHWQARARAIEDRLSDALHERLTQRFVDRRTAVLVRRLREGGELLGAVRTNGDVLVEGEFVGRLEGFRFLLDSTVDRSEAKPLLTAARRALLNEIPRRLKWLEQDDDGAFNLSEDQVCWRGYVVARLRAGGRAIAPRVEVVASDFLDGRARERVRLRLTAWLTGHLRDRLPGLFRIEVLQLSGSGRGLVYQLAESLGTLPRRQVAAQIDSLNKSDRRLLARAGVRVGRAAVFLPALLKPRRARLRALLWATHARRALPSLPPGLPPSFLPDRSLPTGGCLALGYLRLARPRSAALAVRADVLERLGQAARDLAKAGPFAPPPDWLRLAGCDDAGLRTVLETLEFRHTKTSEGIRYAVEKRRRQSRSRRKLQQTAGQSHRADSPFAVLGDLAGQTRRSRRKRGPGSAL